MSDFTTVIERKKQKFLALKVHFLLLLPAGKGGDLDTQPEGRSAGDLDTQPEGCSAELSDAAEEPGSGQFQC